MLEKIITLWLQLPDAPVGPPPSDFNSERLTEQSCAHPSFDEYTDIPGSITLGGEEARLVLGLVLGLRQGNLPFPPSVPSYTMPPVRQPQG